MDRQELERLIQNPRESLDTELKQWIDPTTPEGRGKIAIACIALRNNNGGCLVIGIKNDGKPSPSPPRDVRATFHGDTIQRIVSDFASQPFPVVVEFVERAGIEYPIVCVPSGVETPVAAKSDLADSEGKPLVKCDAVYVRTLHSNHTVSSSAARWRDWPQIARHCFDNREADIGAFIRRHLSNLNLGPLSGLFTPAKPAPTAVDRARAFLDTGKGRFDAMARKRGVDPIGIGTFEAAIVIDGQFPPMRADEDFYFKLLLTKPRHSGWSLWMDARNGPTDRNTAYVFEGGWETCLVDLSSDGVWGRHLDFWRAEPNGSFYHLRGLWDDLPNSGRFKPHTYLDFALHARHVAEAVSIGSHFARSLGCDEKSTNVAFGCRWTGLEGRHLYSWTEPDRSFYSAGAAEQDSITTDAVMPLETPPSGFSPVVESLVAPMYALFGGQTFQPVVVDQIVRKTMGERY